MTCGGVSCLCHLLVGVCGYRRVTSLTTVPRGWREDQPRQGSVLGVTRAVSEGCCCYSSSEILWQPSRLSKEAQGDLIWPPFLLLGLTSPPSHLAFETSQVACTCLLGPPMPASGPPCMESSWWGPRVGCPVVVVGPSSHSSHLVFGQIALDGGLRLTVPSALLSSSEAAVVSSPLSTCLEHPSAAVCPVVSARRFCLPSGRRTSLLSPFFL